MRPPRPSSTRCAKWSFTAAPHASITWNNPSGPGGNILGGGLRPPSEASPQDSVARAQPALESGTSKLEAVPIPSPPEGERVRVRGRVAALDRACSFQRSAIVPRRYSTELEQSNPESIGGF